MKDSTKTTGRRTIAMKKLTILLVFVSGIIFNANTQPPTYDDLVIYYADGDYEKLLKKAEKYTQKDESAKDAIPYYWLAKTNFEMSKDQKWKEKYPKAYNDAIRYAGNALKKDKDGQLYEKYTDFFTDLKVAVVEDIKNMVDQEQWMRLRGGIAKLHRFDRDDVGSYFLQAGAELFNKNKSGAKLTSQEAFERLDKVENVDNWRPIDKEMLRVGVITYCNAQIDILRQTQPAKDLLGRVKQWLEDDEIFMEYYDKVVN
ncbi:MAG: hypothetical protein WDZ35_11020 [Crocinitomicaceae bacterium]